MRTSRAAAALVVVVAVVAAVALGRPGGGTPPAARVGPDRVAAATVDREVAAIEAQPIYRRALAGTSTLALAAPVSPSAVASATGDPDDLRISVAPVGGASLTRPFTTADLRAAVLTRQLYVVALRQLLAAHHTSPTAAEQAAGRQEARLGAGLEASGAPLWDRLPGWYQDELATRAADVLALERAVVGNGGITPADVEAAYARRLPGDFTTVCLRAEVVTPAGVAAARAAVAGGAGRPEGCAPMSAWSADVAAAVGGTAVGAVAPTVTRAGRSAVIAVVGRSTLPLSAAAGAVTTALSARYTDLINTLVEDQLGLQAVTVSAAYGTYEAYDHQVVSPDALTPPAPGRAPAPSAPAKQQLDPFD